MPIEYTPGVRSFWGFSLDPPYPGQWCLVLRVYNETRMTIMLFLIAIAIAVFALFVYNVVFQEITFDIIKFHSYEEAVVIAGLFAVISIVLTAVQIKQHYQNWLHEPSQKHVITILLMIPVYALSSWLGLVFIDHYLFFDFVRIVYEAYVIHNFLLLLTKYLGDSNGMSYFLRLKPDQKWPQPCCCLPLVKPGDKFLRYLKYGTLQYVLISPINGFVALICEQFHVYEDGYFGADKCYLWVSTVQNTTQLTALYALIWFYLAMKEELAPFSPLLKFTLVKAVVFFTFWQAVALAMGVKMGIITPALGFTAAEIQVGLQNFIVCIEMFLAAMGHRYAFGYEGYLDGSLQAIMNERIGIAMDEVQDLERQNETMLDSSIGTSDSSAPIAPASTSSSLKPPAVTEYAAKTPEELRRSTSSSAAN